MPIHPTAIIEDGAEISADARIGPYCVIGPKAKIAAGAELKSHVTVSGRTTIGERTIVHPFAALGGPPQHTGYRDEDTSLAIGTDNIIREHTAINIGTAAGRGETRVGDHCYLMCNAHAGHDCIIGDRTIFGPSAAVGGHAVIGENVFLGGLAAVHQHSRIGAYAFIGGLAAVTTDLIPYGSAWGNHAHLDGLNIIGLKRRGAPRDLIHDMRAAYNLLFHGDGVFKDRVEQAEREFGHRPEVARIIAFIKAEAPRPLMTPAR